VHASRAPNNNTTQKTSPGAHFQDNTLVLSIWLHADEHQDRVVEKDMIIEKRQNPSIENTVRLKSTVADGYSCRQEETVCGKGREGVVVLRKDGTGSGMKVEWRAGFES